MAKIDVINALKEIVGTVIIINGDFSVNQLEQLQKELAAIPNFKDSELAKAIAQTIEAEKSELQKKIAEIEKDRDGLVASNEELQALIETAQTASVEKIAALESTIAELNDSLADAEKNTATVKTLNPTFKHEKVTYEVLHGCRMMINGQPANLTAEEISKNKEAREILVSKKSGVIKKLED